MDEKIHLSIQPDRSYTRGCCNQSNPLLRNMNLEQICAKLSAHNWLNTIPLPGSVSNFDCIEVRFKNNHKDFFRLPQGMHVYPGDIVAVEASPGHDIGIVSLTGETARLQMSRKNMNPARDDIRKVYRKAKQADVDKWVHAMSREVAALTKTRVIAADLGLKMKVNDVEFQGDDTKAIFYYTAEDRVDFRELIKKLAEEFKIRIEMKQIGMRQEASRLGGIGSCGRELCCATWIAGFHSVSTSAAKIQQLSPNPQKLAGQCSKLKCCLNFEVEAYHDAMKEFPDENIVLKTRNGDAHVQKIDVFGKTLWFAYKGQEHEMVAVSLNKVKEVIALNKAGKFPEKLDELVVKTEKEPELGLVVTHDDLHRFDKKNKKKKNKS